MNRSSNIFLTLVFSIITVLMFSQERKKIAITGTVYMSSSIAPGVISGKAIREPRHAFVNQTIFFKNDSAAIKIKTDSLGIYFVELMEGRYTAYQESGFNQNKSSSVKFGTDEIKVSREQTVYDIHFENRSNRRSSMNNKSSSNSKTTSTKKLKQN